MKKLKVFGIFLIIILLIIIAIMFANNLLRKEKKTVLTEPNKIDLGVKSTTNTANVSIIRNNVYINSGGDYEVKGILNNGTIYIDTNDAVTLNLSKVTMVNDNNALINNRASKELILNILDDCILSDGISSPSAILSTGNLTIAGEGSLLIYGNGGNGITTTSGDLNLQVQNLYVTAKKSAFYSSDNFTIEGGTIIGLGNDIMQIPNKTSKQNTFLFNFGRVKSANTNMSLYQESKKEIIALNTLRDFKTLTISHKDLKEGRYYMLENTTNEGKLKNGIYDGSSEGGKRIEVGISNIFKISNLTNWYGNMDIKRLTLEQNENFT